MGLRNPEPRFGGAGFFHVLTPTAHAFPRRRPAAIDALRRAAGAGQRRGAARLHARLRDLRHAERGAQQRGARLPRAQRLAPCRRHLRRQGQERGLVGQPGRPRQAARHRPLLRHRRQQPGLVLRLDRADAPQSRPGGERPRLRQRLPGRDGRGLGRRPGAPGRRAGHRAARGGDRRQPRRHAGARLVAALSRAAAPVHRRRDRAQPVGAEHRLQRGGAAGDRHRPGVPRRPLRRARRDPAPRPAGGADDRPHHLPLRRRDGGQVRARPAERPRSATRRRRSSSRSRPTCATRATSSASTSTPTPTC